MTYQPKTYRKDGGDTSVVASGGKLLIESGGTLEAEVGAVITGIEGVALGATGDMAANGTSTANAAGVALTGAPIDHVHKIGTHDHSGATKGGAIVLAAIGSEMFTADATGRGKFAASFVNTGLIEAGALSADTNGRAKIADSFFNEATVTAKFADSSIPAGKVNFSSGGTPTTIQPDASADEGTSALLARSDHTHAIVGAAPSAGLAAADAEGNSTSFSRANHVHKATVVDVVDFSWGNSDDVLARWSIGDADNHAFVIALGASHAIHLTDVAAVATDWNVAADTHPSVYIHSDTTPTSDYLKLWHDGTDGFLDSEGGTLALAIAGTAVATITATLVSLAATASIKFLGDTGLLDSAGNEVIMVEAVGSAINYLNVKNAATANPIILECLGTADKGFILQNDQDEEILILTPVASALNEITITSAADGLAPSVAATGANDNIDLSLLGKGTGNVRIDSHLDMSDNTLYGSVAADGNLVLSSTKNATKGFVGIASGEEGMRIGGTAARGTVGTNTLHLYVGTAPIGALNNCVSLYAAGADAASELYAMDAGGNATNLTP